MMLSRGPSTSSCSRRVSCSSPRLLLPLSHTRSSKACLQRAYSTQQSPLQQQQQEQQQAHASSSPQSSRDEGHHINPEEWEMNYWHYQPWWLQPPTIIATGVAFVVASLILDNEELSKTALLAAGPVALYWGVFLLVLPRRFKSFAVEYIETHPEAEEAAREVQHQQVLELIQQQNEQQQLEQEQQQQQAQQQQEQQQH